MMIKKAFFVLFIVCMTTFCLISFRTFQSQRLSKSEDREPIAINPVKTATSRDKTDAVILLTMMRSGSSIVGSIFDERKSVTYLYEPLYPFGEKCEDKDSALALLRHASTCHFEKFKALYEPTNRYDKWSRCKINGICFIGRTSMKFSKFMSRDTGICHMQNGVQVCPTPVDPDQINKHCKSSLLIAMKVIYLCKLEWLLPLLEDPDVNVKVVHLVRDPRSTVNSRTGHKGNIESVKFQTIEVCERLEPNLNFIENVLKNSNALHKYMRIRYEDFVSSPLEKTQKIYDFVGINMTMEVKEWLDEATSVANDDNLSVESPQGIKRNAKTVLNSWRNDLSFEAVNLIQNKCDNAMNLLGYRRFNSKEDLKDLSKPYFNPT